MGGEDQRKNLKIPWSKWKWEYNSLKYMGHSKNSTERKMDNITSLPQDILKISNKWSKFTFKGTRKTTINTAQSELKKKKK